MEKKSTPTRKNGRHLRVSVLPHDGDATKANAARTGLSVGAYLRNVAMGSEIRGVIDQDLVLKLVKIDGDQDRLGGLLK